MDDFGTDRLCQSWNYQESGRKGLLFAGFYDILYTLINMPKMPKLYIFLGTGLAWVFRYGAEAEGEIL
jgi:hypothetical protein